MACSLQVFAAVRRIISRERLSGVRSERASNLIVAVLEVVQPTIVVSYVKIIFIRRQDYGCSYMFRNYYFGITNSNHTTHHFSIFQRVELRAFLLPF
jgi:hypothetical protein